MSGAEFRLVIAAVVPLDLEEPRHLAHIRNQTLYCCPLEHDARGRKDAPTLHQALSPRPPSGRGRRVAPERASHRTGTLSRLAGEVLLLRSRGIGRLTLGPQVGQRAPEVDRHDLDEARQRVVPIVQ